MFEENMNGLLNKIIKYANHVESMLMGSFEGLVMKDNERLEEIIGPLEHQANKMEINIENQCITFLARFAPRAIALRTVLMIIKMNNDLERMADHSVNISKNALYLIRHNIKISKIDEMNLMLQEVLKMLNNCLDSLVMQNTQIAREVIASDQKINELRNTIRDEQIKLMVKDKAVIKSSMKIINITRNLERVADLITNIAEDVIYIYDGIIFKHQKPDEEDSGEEQQENTDESEDI